MSPVGYKGPPKPDSNPNPQYLMNFKKSIKREVSQYMILKDEKYFEAFKKNLWVTTTTNTCEEVLDAHCMPGHDVHSHECSNRNNTFCRVFLTRSFKVIWVKP